LPDFTDRDFQDSVADVHFRPDVIEQFVFGDDALRVTDEVVEHAEGLRRQPDGTVVVPKHLRPGIQSIGGEVHDRTDGHALSGILPPLVPRAVSEAHGCRVKQPEPTIFTADFTRPLTALHDRVSSQG